MVEFEDSARSEAPPEEVWKILYDPARFTEWWEGMETTSVGDGEFTLQQVGVPELQIPNRLEVRDAGEAVVISCLLHDFVSARRPEPHRRGPATPISCPPPPPPPLEACSFGELELRPEFRPAQPSAPKGAIRATRPGSDITSRQSAEDA